MNKVILYGNVGKTPKFNTTAKGTPQAKLSLAPREVRKDAKTDWVQCVAYGKTAELIRDYVGSGDTIIVEDGKLEIITLEIKPGQQYPENFMRVRINRIQFIRNKKSDGDPNYDQNYNTSASNDNLPFNEEN